MAKLFQNPNGNVPKTLLLERKYAAARGNLMLVIAMTVINLILLAFGGDLYFLFSAYIPYCAVILGMFYTGNMPPEMYEGDMSMVVEGNGILIFAVALAGTFVLLYLLAWLCSKGHKVGWLIFALVLFGLDTAFMLFWAGISIDILIDILFHAWVIYYLVAGIRAHYALKKLPPEESIPVGFTEISENLPTEELLEDSQNPMEPEN